ncbi:TBCC domain-containing protein 1-like [Sycon ciliatum]|uniref:TBCC domain-containing protein 1-like n=1 Tax=Sycon ciliatum TaxID=27933 RepID=UPI0031F6E4F8
MWKKLTLSRYCTVNLFSLTARYLTTVALCRGSRGPPVPSAVPKVTEEYLHTQFIKKELPQLLSLLLAPEAMSGGAATLVDSVVPETSVEAMSFLMEGTSDDRRILPVADLARLQTQTTESGYSKITRTFSLAKLQAWIFSLLSTNPFGVDMCIAKRRHTPSVVAPTLPPVHVQPLLIGKTASNRVYAPESRSLVLFSQVTGQTLVRDAGDIGGSGILIKRCHNSTIYLLAPIRFVRVERCNNTVLVLGAVQQFVKLCHCRNVRVYTVTRQLHVSDCSDTTIYACTSNRPLLLYGNSNLTLAPYGTAYDNLTADMTTTGLRVTPNVWDQPLCTGTTAATAAVKRSSSSSSGNEATRSPSPSQPKCYRLMDPAEYFDFSIPFEQAGELTRGKLRPGLQYPIPLPMAFKQAKAARQRSILEATKSIRRGLEGVSQERSTAYVQASKEIFTEWLRDNGYQREIDALGALQMVTSQP